MTFIRTSHSMSVFVDYYSAQNEVKLTAKKLKKYFMVTS